jgi:dolichol-phosphate mannosyltransferase
MEGLRPAEWVAKAPAMTGPELSIIVPTFCECSNVAAVIQEVSQALEGISWEIVFVDDDSTDGTVEEIRRLALERPRNEVRCIHRIGRRGLSSACIEGMLSVSAPVVAVMDADLQHDTCKLRDMLQAIRGGADIAVGTRGIGGGSFGKMSNVRQRISLSSSQLARALLHVDLSDPMSGFFMLRRSLAMDVVRHLSGLGFKILLDIVVSAPKGTNIVEVPYKFRARYAGESKLDLSAAVEFLMLLADKMVGRYIPVRFLAFSFVGGLGVLVHFFILALFFKGFNVSFPTSQTVATLATIIFNFSLNNSLTFRDQRLKGFRFLFGLASFIVISSLGAISNVGIASVLFSNYNVTWTVSALAGVLVGAVWNYAMSRAFTWRDASA